MPLDDQGNHVPDQQWIDSVNSVARDPQDDGHGDADELAAAIAKVDNDG